MICYNLPLLCYENRAQDAPKTLQDTPVRPRMPQGAPETPPGHAQETPRCAQDGSQGAPKTLSEAPKTPQDTHKMPQDTTKTPRLAPRAAQTSSRPRFWRVPVTILKDLSAFLQDIGGEFGSIFALISKVGSHRASVHRSASAGSRSEKNFTNFLKIYNFDEN